MVTMFTTAKAFRGHLEVIQRNALKSWKLLDPEVEIIDAEVAASKGDWSLKALRGITRAVKGIPKVQGLWQRAVLDPLAWAMYRLPGRDWPPVIEYSEKGWRFR